VAVENAQLYEGAEETAVIAERNRLARDLHDAVTQTLFSASMIADVLLGPPFRVRDVIDRTAVLVAGQDDPISLGIIGALGLGALAALFFATVGFVVHAAISTRERVTELALLRALGVSGRQVLAWLWVEQASVLAFSLVAGVGLGLGLAWLIVPSATLTPAGRAPVPPPDVAVPVGFIAGLVVAAIVLLALTLALLARSVGRVNVAAVLRDTEP
jgi:ABC-type antimicrobial peptide transport system permease subunit